MKNKMLSIYNASTNSVGCALLFKKFAFVCYASGAAAVHSYEEFPKNCIILRAALDPAALDFLAKKFRTSPKKVDEALSSILGDKKDTTEFSEDIMNDLSSYFGGPAGGPNEFLQPEEGLVAEPVENVGEGTHIVEPDREATGEAPGGLTDEQANLPGKLRNFLEANIGIEFLDEIEAFADAQTVMRKNETTTGSSGARYQFFETIQRESTSRFMHALEHLQDDDVVVRLLCKPTAFIWELQKVYEDMMRARSGKLDKMYKTMKLSTPNAEAFEKLMVNMRTQIMGAFKQQLTDVKRLSSLVIGAFLKDGVLGNLLSPDGKPVTQFINNLEQIEDYSYGFLEKLEEAITDRIDTFYEELAQALVQDSQRVDWCSGKDNVHSVLGNLISKIPAAMEKSPALADLKNSPYFNYNAWQASVQKSLSAMAQEKEHGIFATVADEIRTLLMGIFSSASKTFMDFLKEQGFTREESPAKNMQPFSVEGAIHQYAEKRGAEIMQNGQTLRDDISDAVKASLTHSGHSDKYKNRELDMELKKTEGFILGSISKIISAIRSKGTEKEIRYYLQQSKRNRLDPANARNIRELYDQSLSALNNIKHKWGLGMIKEGSLIQLGDETFAVLAKKEGQLSIVNYDELKFEKRAEMYTCPESADYTVLSQVLDMPVRQCSMDQMVVRASACTHCPYGLEYGSCNTCMYDQQTSAMQKQAADAVRGKVKVQASEELDQVLNTLKFKSYAQTSDESISVYDTVMKKGSDMTGVVNSVNTDHSMQVLWRSGSVSIVWPVEVEKVIEA